MADEMERRLAQYEERRGKEKRAAKDTLLALIDQLRAAGVSEVIATFSGYGDEGSIETIEFLDVARRAIVLKDQFPKLEETFSALLPDGFEDNDGSSGTLTLNIEQACIAVDIDWNVTTTENEHYEV
jgi:hypothetical protein